MAKKETKETEISVLTINTGRLHFCILGTSPLIFNAMSFKACQSLLLPEACGRNTGAERAKALKHAPLDEYRASVYAHRDDDRPTRLYFPGVAFKKAMATAALDMPGVKKAQIGRLVWIDDYNVDIYGVPQLYMTPVRSADMNRTPDIRTRAILTQWACRVSMNFVRPILGEKSIGSLLAAAGMLVGIGDGRQEKGTFSFGQFALVGDDDPAFKKILKTMGRDAQDRALEDPALYDLETERLFSWYSTEVTKLDKAKKVVDIDNARKRA